MTAVDTDQKNSPDRAADEYERQPVPEHALLNFISFLGQYAGEHCAGTELAIGPLFVAAGCLFDRKNQPGGLKDADADRNRHLVFNNTAVDGPKTFVM